MSIYPHYMRATKVAPDILIVTSNLGDVIRTTEIRRHQLEAMAFEFNRSDARSIQIIDGVRLDRNDVLNLLADLDESKLLAIDPGPTESAYVIVDEDTLRPLRHGKLPNEHVRAITAAHEGHTAIETVTSYGMAVGADVFETCIETGRFLQIALTAKHAVTLIPRRNVKLHVCGAAAAKDSNIILALVERFAPSAPNRGKGTKKAPGWFYGFRADVWQAYALAITAVETGRVWFVHGPSTSPHMRRLSGHQIVEIP